jgi:hypothetical protein
MNEFDQVTQNMSSALITVELNPTTKDTDGQFTDARIILNIGVTAAGEANASPPPLNIFLPENCFLLVTELNMGK